MPKLSLYKPKHSKDYEFFDKRIYEMFTVGGTDIHIHKYLGTENTETSDATQPEYASTSELNIQDLLFKENRDRVYDRNVYTMRGIYNVQDIDFDLSQFGLFLSSDTLFITFHINNTIDRLGRKLMSGDVFELPHLKDFHGLDETLDGALKRYYVVQDVSRASEGYSPTWYPHLYRAKCTPLVDSQEYKDIFDQSLDNPEDRTADDGGLRDLLSTYKTMIDVNTAVIEQAEAEVPKTGYDTAPLYVTPTIDGAPSDGTPTDGVKGYLVGDGVAPNSSPTTAGVEFPIDPEEGDFVLRLDYMPNRLFRYTTGTWQFVEDDVRTNITRGSSDALSQRESFINNTATVTNPAGDTMPSKQSLSDLLKPDADNI